MRTLDVAPTGLALALVLAVPVSTVPDRDAIEARADLVAATFAEVSAAAVVVAAAAIDERAVTEYSNLPLQYRVLIEARIFY